MAEPLHGRLVRLRALEPGDEPLFYEWMNDPRITENLLARYPFSHQQERDWIATYSTISYHHAQFGIELLEGGALVGTATLEAGDPANRDASLGIYGGDAARWGQGIGADATYTVCRFGFEMMNLHRIQLEVFLGNERAIGVYERVGFKHEGRRREALFKFGNYQDILVMGLLANEIRDPLDR